MSDNAEIMAAHVVAPTDFDMIVRAVTTTPGNEDLSVKGTPLGTTVPVDAVLRGRFVTVQADGCDIYVMLSDLATGISAATVGPMGTRGTCALIKDGTTMQFGLSGRAGITRYLQYVAKSGSGFIRIWPSSPALNR